MEVAILAGGIGRRFGGVKQLAPVAPDGATLLEVTLRDAARAGCRRAVVVTAPDLVDAMGALFDERPLPGLEVAVVAQRADDLPRPVSAPRERPWGTAHALWCARDALRDDFLLFNADDHYGPGAPGALIAAMAEQGDRPVFALLGYPLGTTLSREGSVSRALCELEGERVTGITEYPAIDVEGRVAAGPETGRRLPLEAPVSMNAWGFTRAVFPLLESHLLRFLESADLASDECYLPVAIDEALRRGELELRLASAPDRWCGMTWPEDRARVRRRLAEQEEPLSIAEAFGLEPTGAPARPQGGGLIHASWRVETRRGDFLLQRLNATVFAQPEVVAENAAAVAVRVDDALRKTGDTDPRHRLRYLRDAQDRPWVRNERGEVWRGAAWIADSRPADPRSSAERVGAARLLGRFPGLVAAGTGPEPREVLPGFHDTPARLAGLRSAAESDPQGRREACRQEFDRLVELAPLAELLGDGGQPIRFVHNDAKLDNVLVDAETCEPLCVVDLDTVMPGLAALDFGDLVRSAVTGRPEDEPTLERVTLREHRFRDLVLGYLEGSAEWIEDAERAALVDGAIRITYEQALRFLADHLDGDRYYAVDAPGHNLRRARAQIRLLEALLSQADALRSIVADLV